MGFFSDAVREIKKAGSKVVEETKDSTRSMIHHTQSFVDNPVKEVKDLGHIFDDRKEEIALGAATAAALYFGGPAAAKGVASLGGAAGVASSAAGAASTAGSAVAGYVAAAASAVGALGSTLWKAAGSEQVQLLAPLVTGSLGANGQSINISNPTQGMTQIPGGFIENFTSGVSMDDERTRGVEDLTEGFEAYKREIGRVDSTYSRTYPELIEEQYLSILKDDPTFWINKTDDPDNIYGLFQDVVDAEDIRKDIFNEAAVKFDPSGEPVMRDQIFKAVDMVDETTGKITPKVTLSSYGGF